MAIDGYVDIRALFNKARLDDTVDDGKGVVEAHAEVEAAMCEAFGIENGLNISASIFGVVAADGSWSMARFSRKSSAPNASSAVGWEFRNPLKAVRLVQVSGTIQIWEEQSDGTWDQARDLEFLEDGALIDLEDVSIPDNYQNLDAPAATSVVVSGDTANQSFKLGPDTTTSGSDTFKDLTDVHTYFLNTSVFGAEGSVMESYDDDGTIVVQAKLIPALLEDGLPTIGMIMGQLNMEPFTPTRPGLWHDLKIGLDLINPVGLNDSGRFLFEDDGVYRVTFSWRLESGSNVNYRVEEPDADGPTAIAIYLLPGTAITQFPPIALPAIFTEVPWELEYIEAEEFVIPPNEEWRHDWPLFFGKPVDAFTFLLVSGGGNKATLNPKFAHNLTGGNRQFTIWAEIERLS